MGITLGAKYILYTAYTYVGPLGGSRVCSTKDCLPKSNSRGEADGSKREAVRNHHPKSFL